MQFRETLQREKVSDVYIRALKYRKGQPLVHLSKEETKEKNYEESDPVPLEHGSRSFIRF